VVVKDLLTAEECEVSESEVWDFLERHYPSIQRGIPDTWEQWTSLKALGILGDLPVLSPQFFRNRQNPKIHRAFATLFRTEDLLVSIDRASLMRPTVGVVMQNGEVVDKPEWKTKSECILPFFLQHANTNQTKSSQTKKFSIEMFNR